MAAEMKVTDAAVRAAADVMEAWHNTPPNGQGYNDAMRAALEAGLAAMLEPAGWLVTPDGIPPYRTESKSVSEVAHDAGFQVDQLYRIKP